MRRPDRELKGFAKVRLGPGERQTVTIELDQRAFALWDPRVGAWVSEPGAFDILVGRSSQDIVASCTVSLPGPPESGSWLTEMSPLRDWLADEVAGPATRAVMGRVGPILGGTFGTSGADPLGEDQHFRDYFGSMPIRGVLEFAAAGGGPDPDTEIESLVAVVSR
jgi:beta-glucosidase